MPKPRTLEHDFWSDPEIGELSHPARLLAAAMITTLADDEGRLKADPRQLRKDIFGYDADVSSEDVHGYLQEISENLRNWRWYRVDGQDYFFLEKFPKKQRIRYVVSSDLPPFDKSFEINGCENLREFSAHSPSRDARAVGLGSVGKSSEDTLSDSEESDVDTLAEKYNELRREWFDGRGKVTKKRLRKIRPKLSSLLGDLEDEFDDWSLDEFFDRWRKQRQFFTEWQAWNIDNLAAVRAGRTLAAKIWDLQYLKTDGQQSPRRAYAAPPPRGES